LEVEDRQVMPGRARLRVLVVDDHSLVRQGTRDILERDRGIEVVGEAANGEVAISLAALLQPDVVLMDVGLPGISGLEATRVITESHPEVKVLALTIHDDEEYVLQMLAAGAAGYLLKDVRDAELIAAVHSVASGDAVLDPGVTATVLARLRVKSAPAPPLERLTARESTIMQLVARGLENREIAALLSLSPRTVEVHLRHAFRKLGARSRTEAVIKGIRLGLVTVGSA